MSCNIADFFETMLLYFYIPLVNLWVHSKLKTTMVFRSDQRLIWWRKYSSVAFLLILYAGAISQKTTLLQLTCHNLFKCQLIFLSGECVIWRQGEKSVGHPSIGCGNRCPSRHSYRHSSASCYLCINKDFAELVWMAPNAITSQFCASDGSPAISMCEVILFTF